MREFVLILLPAILFGFLIGAGFGYSQKEKEIKNNLDRLKSK